MKYLIPALLTALLSAPTLAASAVNFNAQLSPDNEVHQVGAASSGTTGTALLHVDQAMTEIKFKLDIKNAIGVLGLAGAHFHCGTAGNNGPVVMFLAGAFTPGLDGDVQLRGTLKDQNFIKRDTVCGETFAELVQSMAEGKVYINVHSSLEPAGVIRGQVQ